MTIRYFQQCIAVFYNSESTKKKEHLHKKSGVISVYKYKCIVFHIVFIKNPDPDIYNNLTFWVKFIENADSLDRKHCIQ